jgi:hypothetical protein
MIFLLNIEAIQTVDCAPVLFVLAEAILPINKVVMFVEVGL